MTEVEVQTKESSSPGGKAIRQWLGLLVILMLVSQIAAAGVGYSEWYRGRGPVSALLYQRAGLGLASALMAMVTVVGAVGLILNLRWAWGYIFGVALGQIAVNIGTQVWEASVVQTGDRPPGWAAMSAAFGIVIWSVVPVGVAVLSRFGRGRADSE